MLPFRARVDLGVMAIKEYSVFPKALASLELTIRLFSVLTSAKVQLEYSTAPAEWIIHRINFKSFISDNSD